MRFTQGLQGTGVAQGAGLPGTSPCVLLFSLGENDEREDRQRETGLRAISGHRGFFALPLGFCRKNATLVPGPVAQFI